MTKKIKIVKQKFPQGTYVHIAKDLGSTMSHFDADRDALVLYSYAERYGGGLVVVEDEDQDDQDDYGLNEYALLIFPNANDRKIDPNCKPYHVAWYYDTQLTKIKPLFGPKKTRDLLIKAITED